MEVIFHKNCGGQIKDRTCTKCNKKWSIWKFSFAGDVSYLDTTGTEYIKAQRFQYMREFRNRIHKGQDLRR